MLASVTELVYTRYSYLKSPEFLYCRIFDILDFHHDLEATDTAIIHSEVEKDKINIVQRFNKMNKCD